jgi:hypothetical protein
MHLRRFVHRLFSLATASGTVLALAYVVTQHAASVLAFLPKGYASNRTVKIERGTVDVRHVLEHITR